MVFSNESCESNPIPDLEEEMNRRTPLLVIAVFAVSASAFAAEQTLRLEPAETRVSFTLGATMHTVHGGLFVEKGLIRFDLESGDASGEVVLDARRTETGNAKRDKKMHKMVLESERYPTIVFTPQSIEGQLEESGRGDITLRGTVAIHGAEHALTLVAEVEREGAGVSAELSFTVPYVEWGIKDPSVFMLRTAKEVEVTVELYGVLE